MPSSFTLGPLTFQVWGTLAALGFLLGLHLSLRAARREGVPEKLIWDVLSIALVGMLLGGRVLYVLTFPGANYSTWLDIRGGFSLFGGLLLSAALSWAYLRYRQQDIWRMADLLVPGFIAALILVRVGCFLVGDHVGAVTEFPWGEGYADGTLRHPVALYEILFLSLFLVIFRSSERRRPVGNFFLSFCTAYTAYRFIFDFFRCTDFSFCEARYFFLTGSQWLAAGIFLAFSVFWLVKRAKT